MTLDDDIARVAALRGKTRADYVDPETNEYRYTKSGAVSEELLGNIFVPGPWRADIAAYDALPATARRFIRTCVLQLNAQCYRAALDHMDEEALEIQVQSRIPGQVARWLMRHFDDCHPSLRKYL